jgi:hypothetical protein
MKNVCKKYILHLISFLPRSASIYKKHLCLQTSHLQSSKPPVITRLFAFVIGKPPFFQFFARSLPAFALLLPTSHQQNAIRKET